MSGNEEDSTEEREEKLLSLFNCADIDMLIHDAYICHDILVASGYPKRPSLIFECCIWMIRRFMIEYHELNCAELTVKEDYVKGFIDQALDTVLTRHSELTGEDMIEDPMDGIERVNLVNSGSYGLKDFFTDVACGVPRI